jgi:hypothetical protein
VSCTTARNAPGMAGELTNINIDTEEDGPSKHVEHLRWHR